MLNLPEAVLALLLLGLECKLEPLVVSDDYHHELANCDGAGGSRYAIFLSNGDVTPQGEFRWPRPPHFASGRASSRLFLLFALETSRRGYYLSTEDLSGEDLPTEGRGPLDRGQRTSRQRAEHLSTEVRRPPYRGQRTSRQR
jgi:hypothetical protein